MTIRMAYVVNVPKPTCFKTNHLTAQLHAGLLLSDHPPDVQVTTNNNSKMEIYGELSKLSALFNSDMERFQKKIDASLSQSNLQILAQKEKGSLAASVIEALTNQKKLPEFSEADISSCHRMGKDSSRPRPILVRFQAYKKCSEVWENKTCLKGSGVTLSEFLTKSRHEVFKRARIHFGVKDCWTSEGRIVVLLPNKSRRRIERMSELEELIQRYSTPHNVQQVVSAPTARAGTSSQSEPVRTPSKEPTTQDQPRSVRKCTKPKTVSK
ncbi:unnamed protein product, partial [Iphiclides podalirius]